MRNVLRGEGRHILIRLALAGGLTAFAALPVLAQEAKEGDLEQVEQQLQADRDRAEALEAEQKKKATELNGLRRQAIAAAKKAQRHEAELIALEAQLSDLSDQETRIRESLSQRRLEMTGTLAALQRLSRNPPQTMLAYPDAPTQMVRSAILLRTALPRIREEADDLSATLRKLDDIRATTRVQLAALEVETTKLEAEQDRISKIMRRKSTLLRQTESERREINRRVGQLAKKAQSMRELLAQIEADRQRREEEERKRLEEQAAKQAEARRQQQAEEGSAAQQETARPGPVIALARPSEIRPFPKEGPITDPTTAKVIRYYGQRNKLGQTERGITYATRPAAQIVAPHDGLVVYAGPHPDLESYGQILIIEHDGGYHTLLTGLDRLDTSTGHWILAGEPVGAMGKSLVAGDGKQELYLELRRKGQPINPQRWIASAKQNGTRG